MRISIDYHKPLLLCTVVLLFFCGGCGTQKAVGTETPNPTTAVSPSQEGKADTTAPDSSAGAVSSPETDYYGDYLKTNGEVALVIDCSSIDDNGFNQAAYEGAKTYAQAAGVTYSYYSADENTVDAYERALMTAVENHAKLVICSGSHFEQALGSLQNAYPDIHFLILDGVPKDASDKELPIAPNVHCISYHEEEAGYLAGYMTVMDGYTKLGFIGGEKLPSVQRYGTGFLQGIDAAAKELNIREEIIVDYGYADTFLPDKSIEEVSSQWYEEGTEVIFACGGSIYESILTSAESCGGLLIGADTDHSSISKLFLTSAMKEVRYSVIMTLDDYFASGNVWSENLSGQTSTYGVSDKCIGLPVSENAWRFEKVSYSDYAVLLSRIKNGEIRITSDNKSTPEISIQVNYHNNL